MTMRDGMVLAASTPVAPGIESLILRSGRVSEADWSTVFTEAAPYGRLADELIARGLLGAAAVEVLTQTAVFDAIFAIALGGVTSCTAEQAAPDDLPPLLPADPGLETDRVVRETHRRLEAAAGWQAFGLSIHSRPAPVEAERSPALAPSREAILATVNGRVSTRDIAFSLGRGLYSVLSDLAILLKDGLVTIDPPVSGRAGTQDGAVRLEDILADEPRIEAPDDGPPPESPREPDPGPPEKAVAGLPRRRRRRGRKSATTKDDT
ncbi:hypothetical protein [Actinoallomurus acaciae]|uniref:DprA winged helix domain-containing protein n=1 Tax=Actinoallomurus acaciae TaxID=502577 RepID=A0ABV5YC50_9ACTN